MAPFGVKQLPDRDAFDERLKTALACTDTSTVGVALLNLDRFSSVNDALGYMTGNQVLAEVAARLSGLVSEQANAAYLGGDNFAVVIEDTELGPLLAAADLMRLTIETPYAIDADVVQLTATVGVGLASASWEGDPLAQAGQALSLGKAHGGNCVASSAGVAASSDVRRTS